MGWAMEEMIGVTHKKIGVTYKKIDLSEYGIAFISFTAVSPESRTSARVNPVFREKRPLPVGLPPPL